MPLKIARIETESLGPLAAFKQDLADITLVYGHNETGKTFLVELILQSLFKNLAGFKDQFRVKKPKGRIIVSGLENEPTVFSPSSKNRLDTLLEAKGQGMPPNLARLLIVKGGEPEIDKDAGTGGIGHTALREFLSSQGVLDLIQKNVPLKGTRDAIIERGQIIGSHAGDLGKRNDVHDQINNIDQLLERVNLELADGDAAAIKKRIAAVDAELDRLIAAKKFAAFQLDQESQTVDRQVRDIRDANFDGLQSNYEEYLRKKEYHAKKSAELEVASQRAKHYPWLSKAIDDYQKYFGHGPTSVSWWYFILAAVLLVAAASMAALGQRIPAVVAICMAGALGFWYFMRLRQNQVSQAEQSEIAQIRQAYQEKFNEPCKELSTMRAKLEEIAPAYHGGQLLEKEIADAEEEIHGLEAKISSCLTQLGKGDTPADDWGETILGIWRRLSDLEQRLQVLKTELARYDIDPSDYTDQSPGISYSKESYEGAIAEKAELDHQFKELEQSLQGLKSEIHGVVQDHSLSDWGDLIHRLRELRLEKVKQFKDLTTEIIAGKILHQVVEQNRSQEDEKILASLESETVKGPLRQITQDYVGFEIEEETLRVISKYDERFDLKDLSTGTREQILLALRIGFASRVMQRDSAFLILDDAFQHSDWERRPRLVETVFELAAQGWQIIYFSMDDNIRDLFNKTANQLRAASYAMLEL